MAPQFRYTLLNVCNFEGLFVRKAGTSYFWVCGFGCGFSGVNSYSADGVVFILQCTQDCSSLWKAFIIYQYGSTQSTPLHTCNAHTHRSQQY